MTGSSKKGETLPKQRVGSRRKETPGKAGGLKRKPDL